MLYSDGASGGRQQHPEEDDNTKKCKLWHGVLAMRSATQMILRWSAPRKNFERHVACLGVRWLSPRQTWRTKSAQESHPAPADTECKRSEGDLLWPSGLAQQFKHDHNKSEEKQRE